MLARHPAGTTLTQRAVGCPSPGLHRVAKLPGHVVATIFVLLLTSLAGSLGPPLTGPLAPFPFTRPSSPCSPTASRDP